MDGFYNICRAVFLPAEITIRAAAHRTIYENVGAVGVNTQPSVSRRILFLIQRVSENPFNRLPTPRATEDRVVELENVIFTRYVTIIVGQNFF